MPEMTARIFAAALALALASCGGSGGVAPASSNAPAAPGGSPAAPAPGGSPTTPVRVQGLDVIHVEMTDVSNDPASNDYPFLRGETVCPGTPPRGNECTTSYGDGVTARYDAAYHAAVLADMRPVRADVFYYSSILGEDNARIWQEHWETAGINFVERLSNSDAEPGSRFDGNHGGIGEYSLAYRHNQMSVPYFAATIDSIDTRNRSGFAAAAMGELHNGRPAGSATWRGPVFSEFLEYPFGASFPDIYGGDAIITYNISTNTVDVEIHPLGYLNDLRFSWTGLTVNSDASFYIPGYGNDRSGTGLHPTLGYIDGDFYGPNAGESAGVYERVHIEPYSADEVRYGDHKEGSGTFRGAWIAIKDAAPPDYVPFN